jgi:polar amino acid transport system substrate-binding protein
MGVDVKTLLVGLLMLSALIFGTICQAEPYPLTFLSEENPPFNYSEKGVPKGMAIEVLNLMWERMGEKKKDVMVMPWVRAYADAQTKPGTVLFVTARLPAREKLFKWVGPITMTRLALLTTRSSGIKINSDEDIKKYRVGVLSKDYTEILMKEMGVPARLLDVSPDYKSSVLKLAAGRIDMMVKGEKSLPEFLRSINQNPDDYKVLRRIAGAQVCFAFHHDTPDSVIKQYQNALNSLKVDGTLGKIVRQYQPE